MKAALSLFIITSFAHASIFDTTNKGRCEPVNIPLCADSLYNMTYYPNPFTSKEQVHIEHFKPLIGTKCHAHVQFFVCSVFAPMCPEQMPQAVTACKSVCEEVRRDCISILEQVTIDWPDVLDCDRFPSEPDLCMKPEMQRQTFSSSHRSSVSIFAHAGSCAPFLVDTDVDNPNSLCALPCENDVLFSRHTKNELLKWIPYVSGAAVLLSALTFLTFLIDRSRFRFPERCIFYLSLCSFFFSLPFFFTAIEPQLVPGCHRPHKGNSHLVMREVDSIWCTLSFVFTYYFGLAASLWWFMFAFTWYLSASRKWVPEGLEATSARVHIVAWFAPMVGTATVLMTHSVDASELTGLCGVGNTDRQSLLLFSLVPKALIGIAGIVFLVAGVISMCKERSNFRHRGIDTSKLDKLMVKMCLFFLLYVLPWVVAVVSEMYHYVQLQAWQDLTFNCKAPGHSCLNEAPRPNGDIYLILVLSPLLIFLAPFIWTVSPKTFSSWAALLCCCFYRTSPSKTSSRPLLDPPAMPLPQAPPPRGAPNHYIPLSTGSHQPKWSHHV